MMEIKMSNADPSMGIGSRSTSGFTYNPNASAPLLPPLDLGRIGRCLNLEAMIEDYARKHGYLITLHHAWCVREAKGEKIGLIIASFPVYEIAVQYVLDAIDADRTPDDDDGGAS